MDIKVIRLIREEILPHSNVLPREFVDRLMKLLNHGSIHAAASGTFDGESCKMHFFIFVLCVITTGGSSRGLHVWLDI